MQTLIITLLLSLTACGGNGVVSQTRIGQLAVEGTVNDLHYMTETHSGNTNSEGEFVYEPGENIQFYDGNILVGKTKAADRITSFSLAGLALSVKQ